MLLNNPVAILVPLASGVGMGGKTVVLTLCPADNVMVVVISRGNDDIRAQPEGKGQACLDSSHQSCQVSGIKFKIQVKIWLGIT